MLNQLATPYEPQRIEPLLEVNDVARILKRHRASVYALVNAGELTPIRVGKRLRFEPSNVRAYLERHREGQGP